MNDFLTGLGRGRVVEGTVASIHHFGVFVRLDGELGPGPSGLVRVPEISWRPVGHPGDVLRVGERVRGRVVHVDHVDHELPGAGEARSGGG